MDNRQFGLNALNEAEYSPAKDMAHALWVELDMIANLAAKERDLLPFCLPDNVSADEAQRQLIAARKVTSWVSMVTERVKPNVSNRRKEPSR